MDIKIKKPNSGDWKTLQKLNNQVFLHDKNNDKYLDLDWPFSKKGIKYYKDLANGEYGYCLIAYSGKLPVGYIALAEKDFGYRKGKHIEIENMGVKPEFRSKGIGRMLIKYALRLAKEEKADTLYVEAYWKNKKAINFYKKNGFEELGLELGKKIRRENS